jgi:streptogramin lyase
MTQILGAIMRNRLLVCNRGAGRWTCPTRLISAIAVALLSACVWNAAAYASVERVCPEASGSKPTCYVLLDQTKEGVKTYTAGSGELGGFDPSDLRSAYKLPSTGGSGQTVAVVDAYNDPNAESDLAAYRSHYGLSGCTKASGCFKKVNQEGKEEAYPKNEPGWSVEISLDLDMVSAACPECHILLMEANNAENIGELAAAANEAAKLGATEISNSYGEPEQYESEGKGFAKYDSDYTHPGVPVTVSAGDEGYDNWEDGATTPSFPATVPDVIAVGGTTLLPTEEGGRGWAETVWGTEDFSSGGGGCSKMQPKPSWQDFYTACEHRMDNDVAAVADPSTPVSIYDTYGYSEHWHDVGGTSASSPLIAGVEALSTSFARSLEGADAFYVDARHMFDIKKGTNFAIEEGCSPLSLCNAETGYDGPSGNGTPDGTIEIGQITEYSLPSGSGPTGVTAGPDGNLWFTDFSTNKVGKITTSGTITEYSLPEKSEPYSITPGPAKENAVWFTDANTNKIGKITTSGTITEYSLPSESRPKGITAGPDGNLWFAERATHKIGKITTSGTVTEYSLPEKSEPIGITAGPAKENALWFTERGTNKVGKITTSGTITEYALPENSKLEVITTGPEKENALWFTERGTDKIGKITTSGTITEYALPAGSGPFGIAAGPEKEATLWFTDYNSNKVGKITTSGTITEYALPEKSDPYGIATGPDNNLWFVGNGTSKVGMLIP